MMIRNAMYVATRWMHAEKKWIIRFQQDEMEGSKKKKQQEESSATIISFCEDLNGMENREREEVFLETHRTSATRAHTTRASILTPSFLPTRWVHLTCELKCVFIYYSISQCLYCSRVTLSSRIHHHAHTLNHPASSSSVARRRVARLARLGGEKCERLRNVASIYS